MTEFVKEVSGAEKFFIALNELRPPFIIQLAVEGVGEPTPEALYEALEQTTAVNPGSSLRYEETDGQLHWVLGPPPTLTLVDAPEFTGDHGDEAPFLMWPLDAKTGPSCELLYVKAKDHNYLIFRALHAVMDGQGTLLWAMDFMRCLRGEEPVGHSSQLDVDNLIRRINTKIRRLPEMDALHPFGMPRKDSDGRYFWRRIRIERPLDSLAVGRIAVGLAKEARTHAEGPVRINLPTDLRRYATEDRTTGNLFSGLFIEVSPEATPESIGFKVIQMLYKHAGKELLGMFATTDEAGSLGAYRVKVLWDLTHLHDTGRYAFSATLSHLGQLDGAALSAPTFAARSATFVPLVGDSGCVVALNGFDDHTVVAVGLSDRFVRSGDELDRLSTLMQNTLSI